MTTPDSPPSCLPRGAKQFRQLLQIYAAVSVVTLAVACIASYVIYRRLSEEAALGNDIYGGIRQEASLTYYLVWFAIAVVALAASFQNKYPMLPRILLLAMFVEALAFGLYFAQTHRLYRPIPRVLFERFERHPLLVARPRPGDFGFGISHDAEHRRTTVNQGKVPAPRYVYVFGGSTTYDSGNTDANTWPSRLSALLGSGMAVENYGVLAYSSLENMIQSLFVFRDQPPVCALYYEGWNDLRNSHVENLRNDYSEMELPDIAAFLQPARRRGLLETYSVFVAFIGTLFDPLPVQTPAPGQISDQQDLRLSKIYQDNIGLIAAIGRQFGVRVIFIPQILNYAQLTSDRLYQPFIREKDMKKLMALMNADLANAAAKAGAGFIASPLSVEWTDGDFNDGGHFNTAGADKFARSIVDDVRKLCQ